MRKSAVHLDCDVILPHQTVAQQAVAPTGHSCGRVTQFGELKLLSKRRWKMVRRATEVVRPGVVGARRRTVWASIGLC